MSTLFVDEMDSNVCSLWGLEHNWEPRPQPLGPGPLAHSTHDPASVLRMRELVTGQARRSSLNNKQLGWEREGEEFFMLCQQRERPQQRSEKWSVIADLFLGLWSKFALDFYWPVNWVTATFCLYWNSKEPQYCLQSHLKTAIHITWCFFENIFWEIRNGKKYKEIFCNKILLIQHLHICKNITSLS